MTIPVDPGWLSLLPPLVAIALALLTREVILSLFAGIWLAALLLVNFNPVTATTMSLDTFILEPLADSDHIAIVLFSLMLGGMVGVVTRSGGAQGIVEVLRPYATSRRRGQFFTWLSGLMIFFDDYANTLIRGNTMRPMTDELRISREKLAYIVDSVAAPIAVIAPISTWVGFEISRIGDSLAATAAQTTDPALQAQLLEGAANPFNVFLHSIPYLFYPIFAMMLVLMIVITGREFGPMHTAESRAASGGGVHRPGAQLAADVDAAMAGADPDVPRRWYNALIPILVVVIVALIALYTTGRAALEDTAPTIRNIIGEADPFRSLLWASFAGGLTAGILAVTQRILTVKESLDAWVSGMRAMLLAMVILVLAWGLGAATGELGTGPYLAALLGDSLPLWALPALTFIIAAATAFATGTSWGTMAILFPVVVPLAVAMGAGVGFAGGDDYSILLGAISSIMAGAVFGDHASPISDTTVISSMASACDHIDHVRTQLPYALLAAGVALLVGDLPTALWGVNPLISIVLGLIVIYGVLRFIGRPVDVTPEAEKEVAVAPAR
ncbi:MAG TPA: Na+/H+ antiporter NhaC family protein [Longimicrobiales bacterium]|nr:Na+/H+ antiporter NhaC family protein [Longimicrobiales bacterium]